MRLTLRVRLSRSMAECCNETCCCYRYVGYYCAGRYLGEFKAALQKGENAVQYMTDWDSAPELNTRLAAPVTHFTKPSHYKRKQVRSMGRVALMSTCATEHALQDAGLLEHPSLTDGSTGIAFGSSTGSTPPLLAFAKMMETGEMTGVTATSYIQMMAHTAPVNVGVFFKIKGRVITTSPHVPQAHRESVTRMRPLRLGVKK